MCARKWWTFFVAACLVSMFLAVPVPTSSQHVQTAETVIQVNIDSDRLYADNRCSLREAVLAANNDVAVDGCPAGNGVDTIRLPAGLFWLGVPGPGEDEGQTGDLDIRESVIIEGAGSEKTIIEPRTALGPDRLFEIHAGTTVEIRYLQIRRANLVEQDGTGGDLRGGGIFNAGSLRLNNDMLVQNQAGERGGAIYNTGSLEIVDSRFIKNSARYGGAISNHGTLTVLRGYFFANVSDEVGAIENAAGAQAAITDTAFAENKAPGIAGAIDQRGQMILRDSEFWRNLADLAGAGALRNSGNLVIEDSLFNGNDSSESAGGVIQAGGRLTVRRSQFINNVGMQGGALKIEDTVDTRVENSLFFGNSAYHGAGIRQENGPTTILNTTFQSNGGYSGAGVQVEGNGVTIRNCTFRGNNSDEGGSAINVTGAVTIENSTISGNHELDYSAVTVWRGTAVLRNTTIVNNESIGIQVDNGTAILRSTIVAGNQPDIAESPLQDCGLIGDESPGQIISEGYNLVSTVQGCPWHAAVGDITGTETNPLDPRIGNLADNGGPTFTHALLPGSPAIDAGGPACPAADQRGIPRPYGAACDIGAYELSAAHQAGYRLLLPVISR